MDPRPLADHEYERFALSLFRLELSAEEFAARFGHDFATFNFAKSITRLIELSRACGGWIFFDDEREESWLPTSPWEQRFNAWRAERAGHRDHD